MRLAITCFTAALGSETKVVSGPEPFEAAKEKLRAAMQSGHAPGVMEIWTPEGVTDRFTFKGAENNAAPGPAVEVAPTPPDSNFGFDKKRKR